MGETPTSSVNLSMQAGNKMSSSSSRTGRTWLSPSQIDALYFTGGSTALASLARAIAAVVPDAAQVDGDRFTSVVSGLAVDASRRFG